MQSGDASGLYIGLMSGTSLDGIDGVLVHLGADRANPQLRAHAHRAFEPALRGRLLALNSPGPDELHRAALAGNDLARACDEVVKALLATAAVQRSSVRAVGAHGQTVRHQPQAHDGTGYTLQLLAPALLAELTGIDVVCDFRSRDVAAGGQGAPLVPAFHADVFAQAGRDVAVLNIGGIANLTLLPAGGPVAGFDCGPGNVLMDLWVAQWRHQPYDDGGQWASEAEPDADLLDLLMTDAFVQRPPPKSTGRDDFNAAWLENLLAGFDGRHAPPEPAVVQATLADFTARCAAEGVLNHLPGAQLLLVCGGGVFNRTLMRQLQRRLPAVSVLRTDEAAALHPMHVEACAFAWLAQQHVSRRHGNRPEVTGARGPRVLGALYPASRVRHQCA